jgi:hypothetical protein
MVFQKIDEKSNKKINKKINNKIDSKENYVFNSIRLLVKKLHCLACLCKAEVVYKK